MFIISQTPALADIWARKKLLQKTGYVLTLTQHIVSYHIISYHIISYHIISYHIISYHIISYHIISYNIISYPSGHRIAWMYITSLGNATEAAVCNIHTCTYKHK